jgi:hypothetical protein
MVKYYDMSTAAARAKSNKERKEAAEQKEQAQVDKVRANTMPVGSVKRAGSLLPNSMLKEKKTLGGGLTPNLRTMSAPSGGEKKDPPKKKKDPIVSKAELDKSGFTNLRDFMNAKKYDEATGKFVKRAKALTRRDGKPANAVVSETTKNPKGFNGGGSASSRGDGCVQHGRTRG